MDESDIIHLEDEYGELYVLRRDSDGDISVEFGPDRSLRLADLEGGEILDILCDLFQAYEDLEEDLNSVQDIRQNLNKILKEEFQIKNVD